jgi:hypothetical protein
MSGGELALAFVLLTTPAGAVEEPPVADQWPAIQKSVQQLAVEWEILDKNETKFLFANRDEFGKDLNILRRRYQELKDVPLVADTARLPDRQTVCERIRFNREYRKTLEVRSAYESDRAEEIRGVMCETDRLYQVWDSVRDAKCDYYYVTVRRQALKKVRDLIGEEAYTKGELPPNVPVWRFADAR